MESTDLSNAAGQITPTSELKGEHRVIERALVILERLTMRARNHGVFEADSFRRCVDFFRLFADACHHEKEEQMLFPALEARGIPREGGPIGCMLEDHRLARIHTAEMADALAAGEGERSQRRFLAAADSYLDLLRTHIQKEDLVLFTMGEGVLTEDDRTRLRQGFCDMRCRAFGGKTREQLVSMIDRLEAEWPS